MSEELKPCPFMLWDRVEVVTGHEQPDWCGDWDGVSLFIIGIKYNFKKGRYELTVAENMDGDFQTDEMPADCMRLVYRANEPDTVSVEEVKTKIMDYYLDSPKVQNLEYGDGVCGAIDHLRKQHPNGIKWGE